MSQSRRFVDPGQEHVDLTPEAHERRKKQIADMPLPDHDVTYHLERFHPDKTKHKKYDPQIHSRPHAHSSLDQAFTFPDTLTSSSGGSDRPSFESRKVSRSLVSVASHEKSHGSITALPQFPDSTKEAVKTKPDPLKIIKEPARKLKQALSPTKNKQKPTKQDPGENKSTKAASKGPPKPKTGTEAPAEEVLSPLAAEWQRTRPDKVKSDDKPTLQAPRGR